VLARWPIRNKLLAGLVLLVVIVTIASGTGLYGLYAYRGMVKSLSSRANELPLATTLIQESTELRLLIDDLPRSHIADSANGELGPSDVTLQTAVAQHIATIIGTIDTYREQIKHNEQLKTRFYASRNERTKLETFAATFARVADIARDQGWLRNPAQIAVLARECVALQALAFELPTSLQKDMQHLAGEVRNEYRSLIYVCWITSILAGALLALLVKLFYDWVFRPLRILIKGSRKVAGGSFDYRIHLDTLDEMAELAEALNDMTARFQHIRDDLDRQVQERTKQVVRSEQLASVGFLAAGVAHEINNPLASIAMCAESLEGRLAELLPPGEDRGVAPQYLRMIQDEAFRCKEITSRLLDFARLGDVQRQDADLVELVYGVIGMLGHLGKYQNKRIEFTPDQALRARVNPQEIKQVLLNLLTNALDSVEPEGHVRVTLGERLGQIEFVVADDGCGMTPDVLEHIFEPFYTRKRGGQGTGLGLSITYRIVADHGGQIEATSEGPGRGTQFRVILPRSAQVEETNHRYQAA
jgi:signal transduction histidine kinase